ncbi:VWA domain-containing protein [Lachnospiraceae bacterium ZAX-1]
MDNYQSAVPTDHRKLMRSLGGSNNEPDVMGKVMDEYEKSKIPAYVLFITDGGVSSESKIKKLLIEASRLPIFWQFVGVGGTNYGVLERLDAMGARYVDNANFFAIDDFDLVSDSEIYERLLNEFPTWLKEIRKKNMI